MTTATHVETATLPRAARPRTVVRARRRAVRGPLMQAAIVVRDLLGVIAIALCIPFVILAIGTPLVLCVRLFLWLAERL